MNAPDKLMVIWDGQTMKVLINSSGEHSEEAFTGDRRKWPEKARFLFRTITGGAKPKKPCLGFINCH